MLFGPRRAMVRHAMGHLDRYTNEICSELRDIAEFHCWSQWDANTSWCEDVLEDLELTYHLHFAADMAGRRAGWRPMPRLPLRFIEADSVLDPRRFLDGYKRRHTPAPLLFNQSDNRAMAHAACF